MSVVCYPIDAVSNAPSFTGEMVRQALAALMGSAPSGRPLGANTGVRPGTPTSTVSVSSGTWTCTPHAGILDVETSATAGAYLYAVGTNQTGTVTAADATNPRIDIVYIQVSDPAEGDGSTTPQAQVLYLAGTPAATPSAPATPGRSMVLAQINVPKSGGGSPSVTWVAPEWNSNLTAYSYGSTTTAQNFVTSAVGTVNTWSLTTKNITYSSGTWTVQVPGFYRIEAGISFASIASPTGIRQMDIMVNGSQVSEDAIRGDAGYALPMHCSIGLNLVAGDTISVTGYQSQGVSLALSGFAKQNHVSISRTGNT